MEVIVSLLIVISLKVGNHLRKAGLEIENKNLTQAGNYWLGLNTFAIIGYFYYLIRDVIMN